MARMKTFRTNPAYTKVIPGPRQSRIRIAQPKDTVISLRSQNVVREEYMQDDPWWFTFHRRGLRPKRIGDDPLETRAVSHDKVKGTLPERILYKALTDQLRLVPGIDFDFQSSQQGGRMELGGLVADFLFPIEKLVIQVQGPTHTEFLRMRKDSEQTQILSQMGYQVVEIDMETIYNEPAFNEWLRRTWALANGIGGGGGTFGSYEMEDSGQRLWQLIQDAARLFYAFEASLGV